MSRESSSVFVNDEKLYAFAGTLVEQHMVGTKCRGPLGNTCPIAGRIAVNLAEAVDAHEMTEDEAHEAAQHEFANLDVSCTRGLDEVGLCSYSVTISP